MIATSDSMVIFPMSYVDDVFDVTNVRGKL
jgi:hypothetical protein